MKKVIKPAFVLFLITAIVTGALSFANFITKDIIAQRKETEAKEARQAALKKADEFSEIDIELFEDEKLDFGILESAYIAYDENKQTIGAVISVKPKGYGGEVKITAGILLNGNIENVVITEHEETPGLGAKAQEDKFINQFKDLKADKKLVVVKTESKENNQIEAISGATISSDAVVRGVNIAKETALLIFSNEEAYIK